MKVKFFFPILTIFILLSGTLTFAQSFTITTDQVEICEIDSNAEFDCETRDIDAVFILDDEEGYLSYEDAEGSFVFMLNLPGTDDPSTESFIFDAVEDGEVIAVVQVSLLNHFIQITLTDDDGVPRVYTYNLSSVKIN